MIFYKPNIYWEISKTFRTIISRTPFVDYFCNANSVKTVPQSSNNTLRKIPTFHLIVSTNFPNHEPGRYRT